MTQRIHHQKLSLTPGAPAADPVASETPPGRPDAVQSALSNSGTDRNGADTSGAAPARGPRMVGPEQKPGERGGRDGPEPTRYGDWEVNGRCTDF